MTASLETIRAAIRERMEAVAGIGTVQPYERYAKAESQFAALYMTGEGADRQLLGWHIRRVATREFAYSSLQNRIEHDFVLRGWMALQDERQSEILMDGLVEKLRAEWRRDPSLDGIFDAPVPDGQPWGLQLVESQPYMLGGVLCHGVRLTFTGALLISIEHDPDAFDDFSIFHANWDVPPIGNVLRDIPADNTADATDHTFLPQEPDE